MKNHSKHADELEPYEEPQILEELAKKSEEVKTFHKEIESLMSEVRQVQSKKIKINKERLIYIIKKFDLYIKSM